MKKNIDYILVIIAGIILTPVSIQYAAHERGYDGAYGFEVIIWLILPLMYYILKGCLIDFIELKNGE